jgi:HEAT repeat protein
MSTFWLACLGFALAASPDLGGTGAPAPLAASAVSALAAPDAAALAASSLVGDDALSALAANGGWRVRARASAALQWRTDPALARAVTEAAPILTRKGTPRFADPTLTDPDAAGLLVERLLAGADRSEHRAALVEALGRTGGDWSEAAAGLAAAEPDAAVRAQLVALLRDADADAAYAGLARAAADADAGVRGAAMRAIGGRTDGAALAESLVAGTRDPDAAVRAFAARSAGWLRVAAAWDAVAGLLVDADADVRLQAVNALERLDAPRAAALPALTRLTNDPDARVARAALRASGG